MFSISFFPLIPHGKRRSGHKGGWTHLRVNGAPNQILRGRTPQVNGLDLIAQSGNYCYSFSFFLFLVGGCLWMRIKNSHRKITMTHTQTACPNRIALRAGKKKARSVEVGALAPMLEKSTTQLKQKQKLRKYKSAIQIATFDVKTLNRIGQRLELTASSIDHNNRHSMRTRTRISSLRRYKIPRYRQGMDVCFSLCIEKTVHTAIGDVGMLISSRALKSLHNIEKIQ